MIDTLQIFFEHLLKDVRENEPMSSNILTNKLMEEVGELAEAVLLETGHLQHKKKEWSCTEEAADVIIVVLAVLAKVYPNSSEEEILADLMHQLDVKYEKYERNVLHPERFAS